MEYKEQPNLAVNTNANDYINEMLTKIEEYEKQIESALTGISTIRGWLEDYVFENNLVNLKCTKCRERHKIVPNSDEFECICCNKLFKDNQIKGDI